MTEWIVKYPKPHWNQVGIKIKKERGRIEIVEFHEDDEFDSIDVTGELDSLIRYLKEVEDLEEDTNE